MLKQERARVTRNNIVSSAARSFHQHGFSKASLSDIIDEAGVTKGALYFHFESKEDVARAVLESQLDRVSTEFAALEGSGLPPLETLVRLCVHPVPSGDDTTPSGFRLANEIASLQPALTLPFYAQWLRMIAGLVRSAADAGHLRPGVDPERLSRVILSAVAGAELVSEVLTKGEHMEWDERDLWRLLFQQTVAEEKLDSFGAFLDLALEGS
jgi:AcrR family transcriptional regulator